MASNYRIEHINFYVADINTTYHAILGWPALAKFMAIPHYAYVVSKMPLPVGVLALWANLSIAYAYKTESLALTDATTSPSRWLAWSLTPRRFLTMT